MGKGAIIIDNNIEQQGVSYVPMVEHAEDRNIIVPTVEGKQGPPGFGVPGIPGIDGTDGANGADALNIELQTTATYIQWRYVGGVWNNLILLTDLIGPQGVPGIPGNENITSENILTSLKIVDGTGSGLDADLLDGNHGSYYAPINNPAFTGTPTGITKAHVQLASVDNTADANKPVSTAQQNALNLKANIASPTFTGTVAGITKAMIGGLTEIDNTADINKPVSTAQQNALNLKANIDSPTFTGTVGGITKSMVGLGNVTNTSDADKPVSTAQQSALNLKANLAGAAFTGAVTNSSTFTAANFILNSDRRLKTNIEDISTDPVDIDYKQFELLSDLGQKRYGVIAQELQKTNPELVREDDKGMLSVAYIDLFIKEIASLKHRIAELEGRAW